MGVGIQVQLSEHRGVGILGSEHRGVGTQGCRNIGVSEFRCVTAACTVLTTGATGGYRSLWHLANSATANSAPCQLSTYNLGTLQTRHLAISASTNSAHVQIQTRHPVKKFDFHTAWQASFYCNSSVPPLFHKKLDFVIKLLVVTLQIILEYCGNVTSGWQEGYVIATKTLYNNTILFSPISDQPCLVQEVRNPICVFSL